MERVKDLKKLMLYAGMLFLVFGFNSCSDDDDGEVVDPDPTGIITVADDDQVISQNTLVVDQVTANTDVWLVAHHNTAAGEIIGQKLLTSATNTDVELNLDGTSLDDGDTVVLMLHVDNGYNMGDGTFNETNDTPIPGATETVMVNTPDFTISDATVTDNTITFDNVNLSGTGYIVLYDGDPNNDESEIVGYELVTNSQDDVVITFDDDFVYTEGDPLFVRLHVDDPADEEFTFEDDPTQDLPEFFGFDVDNTIWDEIIFD
ncbi:DUF7282 domain-containing protein [Salinimicrobium flavum]|uniref:DUF7282 domain-containing protein n=1 Tax=Salinimicrobium flavum TaxID=1737065 RepID=A0ABW5IVZ0_9FLAO